MSTYPNSFTGPAPRLYRIGYAAFNTFTGLLLGVIVAFGWILLVPDGGKYSPSPIAALVLFIVPPVAFTLRGWLYADRSLLKKWNSLPRHWKVDPIEITEEGVAGEFLDALDEDAPPVHLVIPYSLIENVVRSYERGYWISGWKRGSWVKDAWQTYLANHPEAAKASAAKQGAIMKENLKEILGKEVLEVPLFDRGGIFLLNIENGPRVKQGWEAWKAGSRPLSREGARDKDSAPLHMGG